MIEKMAAVIGANYGDEGKGRTVEYLVTGSDSLVVRFNGGAQAGHTVERPNGHRHVFHHIGSGTYEGAATFLSRFFLTNPLVFMDEVKELKDHGIGATVIVDPLSPVTTPYDMMINRTAEVHRGEKRHGSCGMGINETVERTLTEPTMGITVSDFKHPKSLKAKLERIRREYVPKRLREMGVSKEPEFLRDDNIMRHFLTDCEMMLRFIEIIPWEACLLDRDSNKFRNVVFEGAQGLLLDELSGNFPHVTRSRTGIPNVLTLVKQSGFKDPIDVVYVTRPYVTRHGAGPLEGAIEPPILFFDQTNVANPYQGSLRFGTLVIDKLAHQMMHDLTSNGTGNEVTSLSVTCIDQMGDDDVGVRIARAVHEQVRLKQAILCAGPTKKHTTFLRF